MRKKIDDKLKARVAIEAIRGELTASQIASKYGVHPNVVSKYKKFALEHMDLLFSKKEDARVKELEAQQENLYRHIGAQKVDIDFLKKKCRQMGLL